MGFLFTSLFDWVVIIGLSVKEKSNSNFLGSKNLPKQNKYVNILSESQNLEY